MFKDLGAVAEIAAANLFARLAACFPRCGFWFYQVPLRPFSKERMKFVYAPWGGSRYVKPLWYYGYKPMALTAG